MSEKRGIPHISTGDIFRENIKNNTELGRIAKEIIDSGKLVPDDITIRLIKDRIAKEDCKDGFILDGFPRNIAQAEALDSIVDIDHVILIDVDDDESIRRISGRRTCKECGAIFSVNIDDVKDTCPKCGGKLYMRDDDTPDAVRERLRIYHDTTEPIIQHYKDKVIVIDGKRRIEEIEEEISKKLS